MQQSQQDAQRPDTRPIDVIWATLLVVTSVNIDEAAQRALLDQAYSLALAERTASTE